MRDTYIQNLTKLSNTDKIQINNVYKAALKASQQSYFESGLINKIPVIDLLEGSVKYDKSSGKGIFIPNKHLLELLDDCDAKCRSVLLDKNLSRFATLLSAAYRDYHDDMPDAYKKWIAAGYTGSQLDFENWVIRKLNDEKK